MADFSNFRFDEGNRIGYGHQRPETQEQFSAQLCFSKPSEDVQQISRYSLFRSNVVGCCVAPAYQDCYSKRVDHLMKAVQGFEYPLARTSVREEIGNHQSVFPRVLPPSASVITHERAQEYSYIVGIGEKRRRIEERKVINRVVAVDGARWIRHYSSSHWILLVGEGDFSFAACLAGAFGIASKMIATSLDSAKYLMKNYQSAAPNLEELRIRCCKVMHGIDATEMVNHDFLRRLKFDRIVFNFPFAGFFKEFPRDSQICLHRRLVSKFLQNAKEMISWNGEIHISHKTNGFHKEWNLESIASSHGLRLIDAVEFNLLDFPGYNTKCGFGGDHNFNCYPSKTFKFGLKMV